MIKFRAWDKVNGCWASIDSIVLCDDGSIAYLLPEEDDMPPYLEEEVEIMQYTGLKDNNGREVYEGDVVKNEYGKVMDIQYDPRSAAFGVGDYYFGTIGSGKILEVIGNIYENPELLEAE
ncbi:hypothetical protein LASAK_00476 [Latilactobacillus sakei]|nr:hypothetical protein LASAK_00476 [Latilactobacillus sakei]